MISDHQAGEMLIDSTIWAKNLRAHISEEVQFSILNFGSSQDICITKALKIP